MALTADFYSIGADIDPSAFVAGTASVE